MKPPGALGRRVGSSLLWGRPEHGGMCCAVPGLSGPDAGAHPLRLLCSLDNTEYLQTLPRALLAARSALAENNLPCARPGNGESKDLTGANSCSHVTQATEINGSCSFIFVLNCSFKIAYVKVI